MKKVVLKLIKGMIVGLLCVSTLACPIMAEGADTDDSQTVTETIEDGSVPTAAPQERPGSAVHQSSAVPGYEYALAAMGFISLAFIAYIIISGEVRENA